MFNIKEKIREIPLLYRVFLFCFRRSLYRERENEKKFVRNLGNPALIFDIGANIGNKTAIFCSIGAVVIAIEPDITNFSLLKKRFRGKKKINILPYAVSDSNGVAQMFSETPGSAFNTLSGKWKKSLENPELNRWNSTRRFEKSYQVETVTLDSLIDKFGNPDYIKIDVEGHELACISGLSERVKVVSFEANLPEFQDETLKIITHLSKIDVSVMFNYTVEDTFFELKKKMKAEEFCEFISQTNIRYMDVYAFMSN